MIRATNRPLKSDMRVIPSTVKNVSLVTATTTECLGSERLPSVLNPTREALITGKPNFFPVEGANVGSSSQTLVCGGISKGVLSTVKKSINCLIPENCSAPINLTSPNSPTTLKTKNLLHPPNIQNLSQIYTKPQNDPYLSVASIVQIPEPFIDPNPKVPIHAKPQNDPCLSVAATVQIPKSFIDPHPKVPIPPQCLSSANVINPSEPSSNPSTTVQAQSSSSSKL